MYTVVSDHVDDWTNAAMRVDSNRHNNIENRNDDIASVISQEYEQIEPKWPPVDESFLKYLQDL